MKRSLKIIFLLLAISLSLKSQNLIENGSFELLQDSSIYAWWNPSESNYIFYYHSAFYFNPLFNGSTITSPSYAYGVPKNIFGYQIARTGLAYSNIRSFKGPVENSQIIFPLKTPLDSGSCYKLRYYISWADLNTFASDAFDAAFTKDSLTVQHILQDIIVPDIENTNGVILDSINWTPIEGQYIANGSEKYLTIGNFYLGCDSIRSIEFHFIDSNIFNYYGIDEIYNTALYYIDDVAIWECNAKSIPANAGEDVTICNGDSALIGTLNSTPQYYHFWSTKSWMNCKSKPDTISIQSQLFVSPQTTTTYYLWTIDYKWDYSYDSITVFVEECPLELNIPNIFTPNNDGFNDFFIIENKLNLTYDLKIFNRWGSLLFEGNQDSYWDGTHKDFPVHEGVYFYTIVITGTNSINRKSYSGVIHLLR